ncbi:MAG: biopolymer transporter ExbD [Phycisphaerae bacterium]
MRRGPPEPAGERIPNLAPMVDIIMVILIFFMLGAKLLAEGVLETELDPRSGPGAGTAVELIPAVKIALENVDDGKGVNIVVNAQPLPANSFAGLQRFMEQRAAAGADVSNPVVIAAQGGVRWKFVVSAMDAAIQAGFKNVQFAVSLGGEGKRS